jgi:hypothetical protein
MIKIKLIVRGVTAYPTPRLVILIISKMLPGAIIIIIIFFLV